MQNVFLWSSVTYECTHVTPSSAFVPTTDMQACAPCSVDGISSPSGKVRSTMKRPITSPPCNRAAWEGRHRSQAMWTSRPRHPGEGSFDAQFGYSFPGQPCRDLDPGIEAELGQDVVGM